MMRVLCRLVLVAGAAFGIWLLFPATAAQAAECGGAGYHAPGPGAPGPGESSGLPEPMPKACNKAAGNGSKVGGGLGAAAGGGGTWWVYRKGKWRRAPGGGVSTNPFRSKEELTEESEETTLKTQAQKGIGQDPNIVEDVTTIATTGQPKAPPLESTSPPLAYSPDQQLAIAVAVTARYGIPAVNRAVGVLRRLFGM